MFVFLHFQGSTFSKSKQRLFCFVFLFCCLFILLVEEKTHPITHVTTTTIHHHLLGTCDSRFPRLIGYSEKKKNKGLFIYLFFILKIEFLGGWVWKQHEWVWRLKVGMETNQKQCENVAAAANGNGVSASSGWISRCFCQDLHCSTCTPHHPFSGFFLIYLEKVFVMNVLEI